MRINSVKYLLKQGTRNIMSNKLMAFASFCVLLVSLLLVGFSLLFYVNINSLVTGIESKNEVIVFLDEDTSDESINSIQKSLKSIGNIESITFYSKEEAFVHLKASMADSALLFDSMGDDNPLVDSFKIKIKDINFTDETVGEIEKLENVLSIRAPFEFVDILIGLKRIISIISVSIIIALVIVSMVIISNTTKASVFSRRKEISIMKYVGATNAFIRIPFFVEGMLTGVISGAVATIVTWLGYDSLVNVLTQDNEILNVLGTGSLVPFKELAVSVTFSYILAGAFLGAIGSVISTRKHLKV
ncbi:MAG TPA: ABC transporter permease [Clostridiales bacterium]|nr:ABC transporter permease [Clostridiales bacterium]